MATEDDFEFLPDGPIVPARAFCLLFELLNSGLRLTQDGDRLRVSGPDGARPELSAQQTEEIKKWKHHLLMLLAYRRPEPHPGSLSAGL